MDAGVDDQPRGAEQLLVEPHEVGGEVGIGAHLLAQRLAVQTPALAERDIAVGFAELGAARLAGLDVTLHHVTRDTFVTHQVVDAGRILRRAEHVHEDMSGTAAVGAGAGRHGRRRRRLR